jgi:hypothetical protein
MAPSASVVLASAKAPASLLLEALPALLVVIELPLLVLLVETAELALLDAPLLDRPLVDPPPPLPDAAARLLEPPAEELEVRSWSPEPPVEPQLAKPNTSEIATGAKRHCMWGPLSV